MKSPSILFSFIALLSVVLLLPSCSDSPTTAADSPAGTVGTVDPQGETDFLLGATNAGSGDARVEVWASNLIVEPQTVSFDAVIRNASRTDIAGPLYFIITKIPFNGVNITSPRITEITKETYRISLVNCLIGSRID